MTRALDWFLDVVRGGQDGIEHVRVYGENPDVDSGTVPEDIWDQGGTYTFTAAGGAPMYISSSNGGDTQDVVITALTEDASGDWNEETLTQTLAGQAKTALTFASGDDPVRILSVVNLSGTPLTGDVYVYENDTVVAGVPATASKIRARVLVGNDRTYMAIYTIPSGKTGYLYGRDVGLANNTATTAEVRFQTRAEGGSFFTDARHTLSNAVLARHEERPAVPVEIAAKTDIKWLCQVCATNNSALMAAFDLLVLG
jgi:hypothetical protein